MARAAHERELATNSRMKSFRSCQRQHHFRYVEGWCAVSDADTLIFGTDYHTGLDAWWGSHRDGEPELALERALAAIPSRQYEDPFVRVRLEVMLAGYDVRWGEWARQCEVLSIEQEFRAPLLNPATGAASRTYILAGKIDKMIRDPNGRVAIVDHKTSSEDVSVGSAYRARLTMDGQISTYFDGAEWLGYAPDYFLYDMSVKPRLMPRKATPIEDRKYTLPKSRACKACAKKKDPVPPPHIDEEIGVECVDGRVETDPGGKLHANMREFDETPDEYRERLMLAISEEHTYHYQHAEIVRTEVDRGDYQIDVWQITTQMRESALAGRAPRNPDSCWKYGRACDYWPVCTGQAAITNPVLYRKMDTVNPELASATAPPVVADADTNPNPIDREMESDDAI